MKKLGLNLLQLASIFLMMAAPAFCDKGDDHLKRGKAKLHKGDYVGAIAEFTKAIDLKPDYAIAYSYRAHARSHIAQNLDYDYRHGGRQRGERQKSQADWDNVIADLTRAIQLRGVPHSILLYRDRGTAKQALGDFDGAIDDFNKELDLIASVMSSGSNILDPGHIAEVEYCPAYLTRGMAKQDKGDFDGAAEDFT